MRTPFGREKDEYFMKKALEQAQIAFDADEVPVGAALVNADGNIIGLGYNNVEQANTQAAHAEIIAIQQAGQALGGWRLNGCWLYVTLEPCKMCMNLCILSRIEGVVFGARSPVYGYQLDNNPDFQLYKIGALSVIPGVCAEASAKLLKIFFQGKRGEKE